MTTALRKYPVETQIFAKIINEGYVYVDKTDVVWRLANSYTYTFLSRPRRFGKTLLTSTLHSYFDGDKDLFRGLKIMQCEREWKKYTVLHLDLSMAKDKGSEAELRQALFDVMSLYTAHYYIDTRELTPGQCLRRLIVEAYNESNVPVVVLVDEYDAPLLDVLHDTDTFDGYKRIMREFYGSLKASESMLRFCFLTGITKFSQLSIFSTLNNIKNVSMLPEYAALCGISEGELVDCLHDDVALLAHRLGCSDEEAHERLKRQYDGYHFSDVSPDVYNPFSLMNCFNDGRLRNYWFESGTPTVLLNQIHKMGVDATKWEQIEVPSSVFDTPTESTDSLTPLLYQAGYLTIKRYDPDTQSYLLGIPNQEVRVGMTEGLVPIYTGLQMGDVYSGFGIKFYRALKQADIDLAMSELKAFLAGILYVNRFKQKLGEVAVKEAFYQYSLYLIFNTLNAFVRTEVAVNTGRVDMVVQMPLATYVFEFKVRQSAEVATNQIGDKHYADAFVTAERRVVMVGVRFDIDNWTVLEWLVKE